MPTGNTGIIYPTAISSNNGFTNNLILEPTGYAEANTDDASIYLTGYEFDLPIGAQVINYLVHFTYSHTLTGPNSFGFTGGLLLANGFPNVTSFFPPGAVSNNETYTTPNDALGNTNQQNDINFYNNFQNPVLTGYKMTSGYNQDGVIFQGFMIGIELNYLLPTTIVVKSAKVLDNTIVIDGNPSSNDRKLIGLIDFGNKRCYTPGSNTVRPIGKKNLIPYEIPPPFDTTDPDLIYYNGLGNGIIGNNLEYSNEGKGSLLFTTNDTDAVTFNNNDWGLYEFSGDGHNFMRSSCHEVWFNPTNISPFTRKFIWSYTDADVDNTLALRLQDTTGQIQVGSVLFPGGPSNPIVFDQSPNLNKWNHVGMWFDYNTSTNVLSMFGFLNGSPLTVTSNPIIQVNLTSTWNTPFSTFYLGRTPSAAESSIQQQKFEGYISRYSMYYGPTSYLDIQPNYHALKHRYS